MSLATAIIIPVHNRRAMTLACLARLRDDGVAAWARIIVVDDGSTDGTAAAVRAEFPAMEVLHGDGNLWWTGAIRRGMEQAFADGAEWFVWLNDDCAPAHGALAALVQAAKETGGVTGGACRLPDSATPVYGGFRKTPRELEFVTDYSAALTPVDALNGNLVCVPRAVVERIGWPDARRLPHAHGDTDYTLRARAAGFPVNVVSAAQAATVPNNTLSEASWLLSEIPVAAFWQMLWQKRSYAYLPADWTLQTRHWGLRGATRVTWRVAKRIPITLLRWLVPQAWLRRVWGGRSRAWQREQTLREGTPP